MQQQQQQHQRDNEGEGRHSLEKCMRMLSSHVELSRVCGMTK